VKTIWKTLNSTRFVIVLLILLAVASIAGIALGERFPTGFPDAEARYRSEFGDRGFALLTTLGAFAPYKSFWFQGLLGMLAASLIACSVTRLRVTVRSALAISFRRTPDEIEHLQPHARIALAGNASIAPAAGSAPTVLEDALRRRGFRVRSETHGERVAFAASRGGAAHFGPYLTHLGLILLIFGGMISGYAGREETVWLAPGESWPGMGRGFTATLVDFKVPRTESGQPMQYYSTIEVNDPERGTYQKEVSVNHPLRHRGVSLYQSSFRALPGHVSSATFALGDASEPIVVAANKPLTLPDGRTIAIDDFVSDFRIGENGVESASDEMRNPAVKVALLDGESIVETQWLFIKHPGFRHGDSRLGDLRAVSVEPLYATGLSARTSPGGALIWAGMCIASFGLILSFYLTHRRVWAVVDPGAIYLAGTAGSRGDVFQRELADLKRAVAAALLERKVAA